MKSVDVGIQKAKEVGLRTTTYCKIMYWLLFYLTVLILHHIALHELLYLVASPNRTVISITYCCLLPSMCGTTCSIADPFQPCSVLSCPVLLCLSRTKEYSNITFISFVYCSGLIFLLLRLLVSFSSYSNATYISDNAGSSSPSS